MREMIGRCGFRCDVCMAFVDNNNTAADQARVAEAWSKYFGLTVPPQQIRCNGCLAEDRGGYEFPDQKCPIAPCVVSRGLGNCAFCADYPCEKLEGRMRACGGVAKRFRDAVPKEEFERFVAPYDARTTLNEIRKNKGHG